MLPRRGTDGNMLTDGAHFERPVKKMMPRALAAVFGLLCIATVAVADGPYRMITIGDFDLSFIDEATARDMTGRLAMVDMNATPGTDTGPEIIALLEQDWEAAATYFERRNDPQTWSDLEPVSDPTLIARRTDILRENGTTVRFYVFVSYVQGVPVPRECQAALIARDFASTDPLPAVTLARCVDGLS